MNKKIKNLNCIQFKSGVYQRNSEHWYGLALTNEGKLYAWGENPEGSLGLGDVKDRYIPTCVNIEGLKEQETIVQLETGGGHAGVLTSFGRMFVWGFNGQGQLGTGSFDAEVKPYLVNFNDLKPYETVKKISLFRSTTIALTSLNRVFYCGYEEYINTPTLLVFNDLIRGEFIVSIALGLTSIFAISNQGKLHRLGNNYQGELGLGIEEDLNTPTLLTLKILKPFETIVRIFPSRLSRTFAITSMHRLLCWGEYEAKGNRFKEVNEPFEVGMKGLNQDEFIISVANTEQLLFLTSQNRIIYYSFIHTHPHFTLDFTGNSEYGILLPTTFLSTEEKILDLEIDSGFLWIIYTSKGRIFVDEGIYQGRTLLIDQLEAFSPILLELDKVSLYQSNNNSGTFQSAHLVFNKIIPLLKSTFGITDQKVFAVGDNEDSLLGINHQIYGETIEYPLEVVFEGLRSNEYMVDIVGETAQIISLTNHGRVFVWGSQEFTKSDDNSFKLPQVIEVKELSNDETITAINTSVDCSFLLSNQGRLFGWTFGKKERLSHVLVSSMHVPKLIDTQSIFQGKLISISSGLRHTVGLTDAEEVITWGDNSLGQCGQGHDKSIASMQVIKGMFEQEKVIKVFAGGNKTFYITTKGSVFISGKDDTLKEKLTKPTRLIFKRLLANEKIIQVMGSLVHNVAVTDKGNIFVWGENTEGQLGLLTSKTTKHIKKEPTSLMFEGTKFSLEDFSSIAVSDTTTFVTSSRGQLFSWGDNSYNQQNLTEDQYKLERGYDVYQEYKKE